MTDSLRKEIAQIIWEARWPEATFRSPLGNGTTYDGDWARCYEHCFKVADQILARVLAEVREKIGSLINPYPNPFVFASGRQAIMDILDKMAKG